jgi:branched-chain amino acid transport system substrate-binding protein
MCACTGPFANTFGAEAKTSMAWADYVNANGGIAGHPVHITFEDDQYNPGNSATDAQTLISDHVDVIMDEDLLDATWASAAKAANIPVVGGGFDTEPFFTNSDFYPSGETLDSLTAAIAETTKLAGGTKLANVYCAEAPACQQAAAGLKSGAAKVGLQVPYLASIAATAPNYTAQCLAAKQAGADTVYVSDAVQIFLKFAQDCAQQGYNPIYEIGGVAYQPSVLSSSAASKNLWMPFEIEPFFANSSNVSTMNAAVDKYYPGLRQNANDWSQLSAQAWVSGLMIEDAVKAGGLGASATPSAAEVTNGLLALKGDTLQGWSPSLTFTAGQVHPVDCWFTGKVQNGVASVANNGQAACENGATS